MFKKGDTIVCIDNESRRLRSGTRTNLCLTCNKKYVMVNWVDKRHKMIVVKNDLNVMSAYTLDRFMSILEYRRLKLGKICNRNRK